MNAEVEQCLSGILHHMAFCDDPSISVSVICSFVVAFFLCSFTKNIFFICAFYRPAPLNGRGQVEVKDATKITIDNLSYGTKYTITVSAKNSRTDGMESVLTQNTSENGFQSVNCCLLGFHEKLQSVLTIDRHNCSEFSDC